MINNPFGPAQDYDPDTDLDALAAYVLAFLKKAQTAGTQEKRRQFEVSAGYTLVKARKLVTTRKWEASLGLPPTEIVRLVELVAPPFVPLPEEVRRWDAWQADYERRRRERAEARAAAIFVVMKVAPEENRRRWSLATWTHVPKPKTVNCWIEVEWLNGEHCTVQVLARGDHWGLRLIPSTTAGGFSAKQDARVTYSTVEQAQADAPNFIKWFFNPSNEAANEKTHTLPALTACNGDVVP